MSKPTLGWHQVTFVVSQTYAVDVQAITGSQAINEVDKLKREGKLSDLLEMANVLGDKEVKITAARPEKRALKVVPKDAEKRALKVVPKDGEKK